MSSVYLCMYFYVFLRICALRHVLVRVCIWRPEDNVQESFFFPPWSSGALAQVLRLVVSVFTYWATLLPPDEVSQVCLGELGEALFTGAQAAYWGCTTEETEKAVLFVGRIGLANVPTAVAGGAAITVLFNELKKSFLAISCVVWIIWASPRRLLVVGISLIR